MKKSEVFFMKGIILAGGNATRLRPSTLVTSKQLLPVYDRPMIYYPIETLARAGIRDILIIVSPQHAGHFLNLLSQEKRFKEQKVRFSYKIQEKPRGLPEAFILAEEFIGRNNVIMILGDNIFDYDFSESVKNFSGGAKIFAKQVPDPERFGVVEFDELGRVLSIVEKPKEPKSNYAVVGIYIFDHKVIRCAKKLKPSESRGELEIVDLMNLYRKKGELSVGIIEGIWEDAGSHDSLLRSSITMAMLSRPLELRPKYRRILKILNE